MTFCRNSCPSMSLANPVLCIGQNAIGIGEEMIKILDQLSNLEYAKEKRPIIYVDPSTHIKSDTSTNKSKILRLNGDSNSWLDGRYGNSNIELILDQIVKQFETVGLPKANELQVISDLTLGSGISGAVINAIMDTFSGISLTSVHITPLLPEKAHGIGLLNSLLTLQSSLYLSDGVMIRSLDDMQLLLTSVDTTSSRSSTTTTSASITELYNALASDVVVALSKPQYTCTPQDHSLGFEHILWPKNVCSRKHKLFDVRTSLWKLLTKRQANIPYNSLRAMSANLHSLHLSLGNLDSMRVRSAYLMDVTIDSNKRGNLFTLSTTNVFAPDAKVAIDWAAPHSDWPPLGIDVRRDPTTGLSNRPVSAKGSTRSAHDDFPSESITHTPSSNVTLNTSKTSKGGAASSARKVSTSKTGVNPFETSSIHSLCALSFASPYARHYLREEILEKAYKLIEKRAFMHQFHSYGLSDVDFLDALETVANHAL